MQVAFEREPRLTGWRGAKAVQAEAVHGEEEMLGVVERKSRKAGTF